MRRVALRDIVVDAGTQVRIQPSEDVVADYAEAMTDGAEFPPVVLFHDGNRYYMADGFHRLLAAQRIDARDIPADVRTGTATDALWYALGANKANGHRLNANDKRHAILLALKAWPDKSARQIAEQVGCSFKHVTNIRDEVCSDAHLPARVTGKDGKSYPATRTPKPAQEPREMQAAEPRRPAPEPFEARRDAAAVNASAALLRRLPRKNSAELITNVVHTLQGVTSALNEIDVASVLADQQAPYWRHHIAEAIGALRAFNKKLLEAA